MKKTIIFIFFGTLLLGGFVLSSCQSGGHEHGRAPAENAKSAKYHCPMHPTYTSDRPGDCPICGMRLVPIQDAGPSTSKEETKPLFYRHPMDPDMTSMTPMKDEMGMDYVPVHAEISDRVPVFLSAQRQQLIGVRTALLEKRRLQNIIRASGRVAYDPDLYNAIVEHRQALQGRKQVNESAWPDVRERADALVQSSRLRLRQMGLSAEQIDALAADTNDPTNLLLAEKGGSVWIYAQVYDHEANQVKRGQTMEVASPAMAGRSLKGTVAAVDSILNPDTRTLRVRGEVPNHAGLLRPEMYVDVMIYVPLGTVLAIPEEAVLKTGTRHLVFVETDPGHYAPRAVMLGNKAQEFYEVVSGLEEGEKVVTSANFLIDSESRLKAALAAGGRDGHSH